MCLRGAPESHSLAQRFHRNVSKLPCGAIFQQTRNQGRYARVASALGHHVTFNPASGKRQISDEVKNPGRNVLIREAEAALPDQRGPE